MQKLFLLVACNMADDGEISVAAATEIPREAVDLIVALAEAMPPEETHEPWHDVPTTNAQAVLHAALHGARRGES
jgi:hypothetical protein